MENQQIKENSVWQNLWLALICAPAVWFLGNIALISIGALENLVAKIPWGGAWLFIPAYILTLIYIVYRRDIRKVLKGIEW